MAQMGENEKGNYTGAVFEMGNLSVKTIKVKKSDVTGPPAELLVITPEAQGDYPTIIFCHGYFTQTMWYSQLLQHISSHGYIVIAPQFYQCLVFSMNGEIKIGAKVTKWLQTGLGLGLGLPQNVKPDLTRLALMGHSRGGKIAFSLALAQSQDSQLKFKALLGLDPVSGPNPPTWPEPNILTHIPHSFNISIPIGIIGTGLGHEKRWAVIPGLAPSGFNHSEFFNESRPTSCYFLAKDYGHCDVLNDSKVGLASLVCRSGLGCKEKMRRGVGGLVVAFLKAHLDGESMHLQNIVDLPAIAPIALDPVIYIKK